jgi:hypothetical protein
VSANVEPYDWIAIEREPVHRFAVTDSDADRVVEFGGDRRLVGRSVAPGNESIRVAVRSLDRRQLIGDLTLPLTEVQRLIEGIDGGTLDHPFLYADSESRCVLEAMPDPCG